MNCKFFSLDTLYLRVVCDFLALEDFKRLDKAIFKSNESWKRLLGNMQDVRCIESTYLDIPDLDWAMQRNIRIAKLLLKTSRPFHTYPFGADVSFFESLKELRLYGEAYFFIKDVNSSGMSLSILEIDGALSGARSEDGLEHLLVHNGRALRELSLHNMGGGISDDLFIDFSQVLKEDSLEVLSLSFCEKSTDFRHGLNPITFMCLSPKLTKLRVLELQNFYLVTDESLFLISLHCATLEELDISFCREVTGGGVRVLANNSKNLRRLSVRECIRLNNSVFVGDGIQNPDGSTIPGSSMSGMGVSTEHVGDGDRRAPRTLAQLRTAEGDPVWENLTELVLEDSTAITNEALVLLPCLVPNLTLFSIANCNFSEEGLVDFFKGLDQQQSKKWGANKGGAVRGGEGNLREVCLYGCEIKEAALLALLRHHPRYLERVGFTSKIDNDVIKTLEAAGVKIDWIPWWTDEAW